MSAFRKLSSDRFALIINRSRSLTLDGAVSRMVRCSSAPPKRSEVFVTVDASIRHQQRIERYPIIFVLLEALRNDIVLLEPLVPQVLEALATAKPGDLVVIGGA